MRQRDGSMASFTDVLGGIKLPKSVKDHLKNHEIWSKWHQIVGLELARVTIPLALKGKTLEVTVAHQAWAHQLQFLVPSILNKLRTICPESSIQDLHFKIGKVDPVIPKIEIVKEALPEPVKLGERLEMTLRAVEDEELRSQIRQAMEASVRRNRSVN